MANNQIIPPIRIEIKELLHNLKDWNWEYKHKYSMDEMEGKKYIRAIEAMEEEATTKNLSEYDDCDGFVCAKCGFEVEDWNAIERDEDYQKEKNIYSYDLKYCPDCGRRIVYE